MDDKVHHVTEAAGEAVANPDPSGWSSMHYGFEDLAHVATGTRALATVPSSRARTLALRGRRLVVGGILGIALIAGAGGFAVGQHDFGHETEPTFGSVDQGGGALSRRTPVVGDRHVDN